MSSHNSNELERLAALETKLRSVESLLIRLEEKMDALPHSYGSRTETQEMLRARDVLIDQLRNELNDHIACNEGSKQTSRQVYPLWAAVITSLVSLGVAIFMR